MFNPLDILDRQIRDKSDLYNNAIQKYLETYGKDCIYYINNNKEASENELDENKNIKNAVDQNVRQDNYSVAYGKQNVGFDISKMSQRNGKLFAEYSEFYKYQIGSEEQVQFLLQVKNNPINRGDLISYYVLDSQVFYRINEIPMSYYGIVYRISCRLVQVKKVQLAYKAMELQNNKFDVPIYPNEGIVL